MIKTSELKIHLKSDADSLICSYKSGLLLTPGEVRNWTAKVRKLTSSKHKCTILRVAHGDVYTNDRLFRFGLSNDPKCLSCGNSDDSLQHRIVECSLANEAWLKLEEQIDYIGLQPMQAITLENILGAGQDVTKLELTIRTELLSRLITKGNSHYSPLATVKASLNTIRIVEKLDTCIRDKLSEVINLM